MQRIVSLLPSTTEIVAALGLTKQLVGRSHECDLPPEVQGLPACTEPKLDPAAASGEIDARVKQLVREGLSIYRVDAERLRELHPDVILTQDQCEVCAVTPRDLEAALGEWIGGNVRIVSLRPERLPDVLDDLVRVAEALEVIELGRRLRRKLQDRMEAITARTSHLSERPRLACIEWIDPLMAAGNWMPELVDRAGAENLFGELGRHSPWLSFEALREANPDAVLIFPCGFDLRRTRRETHALVESPAWRDLRAARERSVFLADGNRHFNRPGPRIVESLEILVEILHPEIFRFGHEGVGWERFVGTE